MSERQRAPQEANQRGLLARPLEAMIFLTPLIVFYEVISATQPTRVIAFDLLQSFFELFGPSGIWAPGLGVIVILLSTHVASGQRWRVRWSRIGLMYVEALALAVPLLALNWTIPLQAGVPGSDALLPKIALGVGAGIYEELVFRLVFISMAIMLGTDLLRLPRLPVAVVAILLSAVVFAAHHHQPFGMEPFHAMRFTFRTVAGLYLALVFWYRGYGPAAGCHAAYNVMLVASIMPPAL